MGRGKRSQCQIIADSQGAVGRGDFTGDMAIGGSLVDLCGSCGSGCCGGCCGSGCNQPCCCGTCGEPDVPMTGAGCDPTTGSPVSLGGCGSGNPFLVGLQDQNNPLAAAGGVATSGDQLCADPCVDPAGIPSGTTDGPPFPCNPNDPCLPYCPNDPCCNPNAQHGGGSAPSKTGGGGGGGMSGGGGGGKPQPPKQNNQANGMLSQALARMGASISALANGVVTQSRALLGRGTTAGSNSIFPTSGTGGNSGDMVIIIIIVLLLGAAILFSGKTEE